MKGVLILLFIAGLFQIGHAQCPAGQSPTFWHPDQIDSFKVLYPNCDEYSFETTMIDGEYVKPHIGSAKDKMLYVISLIAVLLLLLGLIKIATSKITYFQK